MDIEIDGPDDLEGAIKEAIDDALGDIDLGEENEIPFTELFTPEFMRLYTSFTDIESFFDASPWEVEGQADFEAIPEDDFDAYVDENTEFPDWETMLDTASERYLERQIG
jgi:hypothetical protein